MTKLTFQQGIEMAKLLDIEPPQNGFSFENFKTRAIQALKNATPAQPEKTELQKEFEQK